MRLTGSARNYGIYVLGLPVSKWGFEFSRWQRLLPLEKMAAENWEWSLGYHNPGALSPLPKSSLPCITLYLQKFPKIELATLLCVATHACTHEIIRKLCPMTLGRWVLFAYLCVLFACLFINCSACFSHKQQGRKGLTLNFKNPKGHGNKLPVCLQMAPCTK